MVNPATAPGGAAPRQGNGLAVAGMVLGILAIVLFWTSFVDLVIAVLAIVFSIVGLNKAKRVGVGKGMALAGLITGIIGLLLAIALVVFALVAVKGFKDYVKKSKATEATVELHSIGKHAELYFGEHSEFPKGSAPLTPADDCCKQPGGKCAPNPAAWQTPVWQALEFEVDDPQLYRYSYESDGKTFTAKAVGDLDCDGQAATYELHGSIDSSGNPKLDEVIAPPAGVY